MNNGVFGETMEILTKYTDIKFVTTEVRRDYLASELNYHTTTFFFWKCFSNGNEKTPQIHMNGPVYLGLTILELSKIVLYEFWYDYVKPKYGEKENCVLWMQTVSLYT